MKDEIQLIERGRQGDETALGSLYRAYHRRMTEICQRIVGNRQVAEELAHDAFLLAFAKIDQLHNPQRFEAWLTSIATNVARRYMQRHHDPAMLSLSTLSEEELPGEPIRGIMIPQCFRFPLSQKKNFLGNLFQQKTSRYQLWKN